MIVAQDRNDVGDYREWGLRSIFQKMEIGEDSLENEVYKIKKVIDFRNNKKNKKQILHLLLLCFGRFRLF